MLIFLLGIAGFLFFIWQDYQLFLQKKEKIKDKKTIDQTIKDLVDSYSYIGEVNRKMDILMNIALGLTEKTNLTKKKETEIYHTIMDAAKFLMKADCALLRFINTNNKNLEREIRMPECSCEIKNKDLVELRSNIGTKKTDNFFIFLSHQQIKHIKCYLIVKGYVGQEEKTIEMMRVLASQALFVFSYADHILD
ncbi:MAG: hypothetical protein AAB487_03245 [Patescibacteria group bacterium]